MDMSLRDELLRMEAADRDLHTELSRSGEIYRGHHPRLRALHRQHGERLRDIIDAGGWPGRSLVGREAAHAAWLLLQHTIGLPALRGLARPRRDG
jgi:hypothetical protein